MEDLFKCRGCEELKLKDGFAYNRRYKNQISTLCTQCRDSRRQKRSNDWKAKNKIKLKLYDAQKYKENKKQIREQQRARECRYKEARKRQRDIYNKEKPFVKKSGRLIARMLKRGKLNRAPCIICGTGKAEAHHYRGYEDENARRFVWLCRTHHHAWHRVLQNDPSINLKHPDSFIVEH